MSDYLPHNGHMASLHNDYVLPKEEIERINKLRFKQEYMNKWVINLFLDDLRPCPIGFHLAKNTEEAKKLMSEYHISVLSLDHDLGEDEPTGYDLTKWMVENAIWADKIYLHTANPVGRMNMHQLLMRYKPDHVKVHNSPIPNWMLAKNEY